MIARYCACGAGIRLVGGDDELNREVVAVWLDDHDGEGHEEVTADEANTIRIRASGRDLTPRVHARYGETDAALCRYLPGAMERAHVKERNEARFAKPKSRKTSGGTP